MLLGDVLKAFPLLLEFVKEIIILKKNLLISLKIEMKIKVIPNTVIIAIDNYP